VRFIPTQTFERLFKKDYNEIVTKEMFEIRDAGHNHTKNKSSLLGGKNGNSNNNYLIRRSRGFTGSD
jgi:hypothetical protein